MFLVFAVIAILGLFIFRKRKPLPVRNINPPAQYPPDGERIFAWQQFGKHADCGIGRFFAPAGRYSQYALEQEVIKAAESTGLAHVVVDVFSVPDVIHVDTPFFVDESEKRFRLARIVISSEPRECGKVVSFQSFDCQNGIRGGATDQKITIGPDY